MNCSEFEKIISLYIDGELPGDETVKAKNHLESCPVCRKLYDEFKSVDGLINNIPTASPEKISAQDLLNQGKAQGMTPPVFNFRRLALAGAFIILLVLGIFAAKDVILAPAPRPVGTTLVGNMEPKPEITRTDYDVRLNDTAYNVTVEGEGAKMISFDLTVNDVEGVSLEFVSDE